MILLEYLLPLNIVQISVEDTGCGIKKSSLNRLGTLNSGTNKKLAGIGLTISNYIARKLAPLHLGGLYVTSEENVGSKFFFLLENLFSDDNKSEISNSNTMKYSEIEPIKVIHENSPRFQSSKCNNFFLCNFVNFYSKISKNSNFFKK